MIRWLRTPIRARREGSPDDGRTVRAAVDGAEVWFRSGDAELAWSPTALACAYAIPALHHGRRLEVEGALSERWLAGFGEIAGVYREWWGYRPVRIRGTDRPTVAPEAELGGRRALCFTGGVDSFYSLLRGETPDDLLFVRGFDIPLEDRRRWASYHDTLTEVAGAVGARPVVLETNLRSDPLFDSVNWERTHGAALAAVGHLLGRHVSTLRIAATLTETFQPPWGSHPRTDPLWSSESLTIDHHGASLWRHEKLWEIQDEPLVREHLRVCWENRAPEGNCSRCDKCLITMLALLATGRLGHVSVFRPPDSFPDALDALPRTTFLRTTELLEECDVGAPIAAALRRLRERTLALRGGG